MKIEMKKEEMLLLLFLKPLVTGRKLRPLVG